MVTDLWMEGTVQCKTKPVRISNDDDKVESVIPDCKVKCSIEHLAPLSKGLVLANSVKKYSGECLAKAQEAISVPISTEMCDQISLISACFFLRDKVKKCLKNKSPKQNFTLLPLPVLLKSLGLSPPKHTKQSFKVEENIHELDHILGGLWDVQEVKQGECFKFVRSIHFHFKVCF